MEDNVLEFKNKKNLKDDIDIRFPSVISHAVSYAMANVVTTLESVNRLPNLPTNIRKMVRYSHLVARDLTTRTSILADLFGESDSISRPNMISYNLNQFLGTFTENLNNALKDKVNGSITFVLDEYSDADAVFDSKKLSVILYYLISNSIQHGRTNNKNVKLLCKCVDNSFELIVRDYGGGIPKENQVDLFTSFRKSYYLEQDGTSFLPARIQGLGLPACMKLIRDMNGDIHFKNYRSGAQFTIIIPQRTDRMHETLEYFPDEDLLQKCMLSLWLYLEEKMPLSE